MTLLGPIGPADREFVLALNAANVELLAPLDDARLSELMGFADLAAIIRDGEEPVGFVITVPAGTAYDSVNYRWFAARYRSFHYLDRVVIETSRRRTGLGSRVYDEIEQHARALAPILALEVNIDPPNEPSLAFHRGRGYGQVDQAESNGHMVDRMVKQLI